MNVIIIFGVYATLGCTLGFDWETLGFGSQYWEISTTILGFRKKFSLVTLAMTADQSRATRLADNRVIWPCADGSGHSRPEGRSGWSRGGGAGAGLAGGE